MIVHRIEYRHEGGASAGFKFFPTKREALAAMAEARREVEDLENWPNGPEAFEIECTKLGVVRALNHLAGHGDNG